MFQTIIPTSRFFSRFWNPYCVGVDAFTEIGLSIFGLFVPLTALVSKVIHKMMFDKVLVITCWKPAAFWRILSPNGNFMPNVVDGFDLPTNKGFNCNSKNDRGMFWSADLKLRKLPLKLNLKRDSVYKKVDIKR